MTNQSSTIVQRLWNYCNVLREDRGVEAAAEAGLVPAKGTTRTR
jgi:hypothetical protein